LYERFKYGVAQTLPVGYTFTIYALRGDEANRKEKGKIYLSANSTL